jgi:hypothetical protein
VHLSHFAGYETVGRGGLTLSEHWADGMRSLHGVHTHGFPNLFIEGLAQGGNLISNITHHLDEAARTIAAVIAHAEELGAREVEVTAEAEQAWVSLLENRDSPVMGSPDCTPGYYNREGAPLTDADRRNAAAFPEGPAAFFAFVDRWRRSGDFEGLQLR